MTTRRSAKRVKVQLLTQMPLPGDCLTISALVRCLFCYLLQQQTRFQTHVEIVQPQSTAERLPTAEVLPLAASK
jgi:hypothetical protein